MKYFVVSDIHSFYTPLIDALNKAGFDKNNPNHILISCGDAFDRGDESKKVLRFLMTLERKVLVKGNHDILFEELCKRGYACAHDISNGTAKTIYDLGKITEFDDSYTEWCNNAWNRTARYRELLVNYFETQNYIFVHSWIPCNPKGFDTYTYREDWREANDSEWEKAMWVNPFLNAQDGLNETGKIIVFGHWHCSFGHAMDSGFEIGEFEPKTCWDPYINEEQGIIGIDRCTAHTGEINVLVIED